MAPPKPGWRGADTPTPDPSPQGGGGTRGGLRMEVLAGASERASMARRNRGTDMKCWTTIAVAAAVAAGAGAAWAEGPPAGMRPAHVAGAGLNVTDLEGQRAWYMDK